MVTEFSSLHNVLRCATALRSVALRRAAFRGVASGCFGLALAGCIAEDSSGIDSNLLISNSPVQPREPDDDDVAGDDVPDDDVQPDDTGQDAGEPAPSINDIRPSSGCGKALPPKQEETVPGKRTGYTHFTVSTTGATVNGIVPEYAQERHFSVRVPADYDPEKPYRVVYIGQGCGTDNMSGWSNAYTLFNEDLGGSEQAIYVAVSLPDEDLKASVNGKCYDNRAGADAIEWEAFEKIHGFVESTYCADNNRVYVSGYSTGGWLTNMWGCYFAGVDPDRKFAPNFSIRGQAAVTGGLPEVPDCGGPVAAIWIHDQFDPANPIAGNLQARDRVLDVNGCTSSATEPWGEGEAVSQIDCKRYTDCPELYPVIFCTSTDSGHTDQSSRAIPAFTQFFDLLEP